ncbi:unnamed protein product [Camellia sinensis]
METKIEGAKSEKQKSKNALQNQETEVDYQEHCKYERGQEQWKKCRKVVSSASIQDMGKEQNREINTLRCMIHESNI